VLHVPPISSTEREEIFLNNEVKGMWNEAVYVKLKYKPGDMRHTEQICMKLKIMLFHYYNS
jgi:hypothetical protein